MKEKKTIEITSSFHNDEKETLVQVDEKLYKLVPLDYTLQELMRKKDFKTLPHVRYLNPIAIRSKEEQKARNRNHEDIHNLAQEEGYSNKKVTSIKKAIKMGVNVPEEINRLLKLKEKATPEEAKKIRIQLRKLDYKRYTTKD